MENGKTTSNTLTVKKLKIFEFDNHFEALRTQRTSNGKKRLAMS
jgi:hypothetical protein